MAIGTLFLIPNTLGTEDRLEQLSWVLPAATITQAAELKYWIVENAKTARAFLKAIDSVSSLCTPLQELVLLEWRGAAQNAKYNSQTRPESLLQALVDGHNMGLMSEAGVPGVADGGPRTQKTIELGRRQLCHLRLTPNATRAPLLHLALRVCV